MTSSLHSHRSGFSDQERGPRLANLAMAIEERDINAPCRHWVRELAYVPLRACPIWLFEAWQFSAFPSAPFNPPPLQAGRLGTRTRYSYKEDG